MFSVEKYKEILANNDSSQNEWLAENSDTPTWVLEELGKNSSARIKELLSDHESISLAQFEMFADSEDETVIENLSANPALPASVGAKLLRRFSDPKTDRLSDFGITCLTSMCAASDFSSPELSTLIVNHYAYRDAILNLSHNSSLPVRDLNALLERVPTGAQYTIFYSLLSKKELDPSTLEVMMNLTGHIYLLEKICNHPTILGRILEKMYAKAKAENVIVKAIATNELTPPELLEKISKTSTSTILASVASNRSTPVEILEAINDRFKDKMDANIAVSLAMNPNTPIPLLEKVASYKQSNGEAVRNANVTYKCLENIDYDYLSLQASIALSSSPLLTTELISRFLFSRAEGNSYFDVLHEFIYHPLTSFEDKYVLAFKKGLPVAQESLFDKASGTYHLFVERMQEELNIDISPLTKEMTYNFLGWKVDQ
jgi:hypothetical protein